jgi:CDP-glucose 4,6-dehydratase
MMMFNNIYKNKKVLVTGHTGFKGTWLCLWLEMLGAKVIGYSIDIPTKPSLFELTKPKCVDIRADINDFKKLKSVIKKYKPEIIFHLAAQPLVRLSYEETLNTFNTNVIGTANVLEAVKENKFVKAVVAITTDKVYLNNETGKAFKETDSLGGYDPYSASKAACEIVISSYRNSFFNLKDYKRTHNTLIASARAGNVIGGGDFALDRIIPDCVRAALSGGEIVLRNPASVRPYQHVLEPLNVYLKLAALQYEDPSYAGSYNVGPDDGDCLTTRELAGLFCDSWNGLNPGKEPVTIVEASDGGPHEAGLLRLNCDKLKEKLGWKPVWTMAQTMEKIAEWTLVYRDGGDVAAETDRQILEFLKNA